MTNTKLMAGDAFPTFSATTLDDETVTLGEAAGGERWQMIIVYRGKHCPLCTRYLNSLSQYKQRLADQNVDMVAVSADSRAQLEEHLEKLEIDFPIYHGLSQEDMDKLGVYVSYPRSEKETDHNFAEPGLFVVNQDGNLHVVDIANNPFVRPDIESLVRGIEFIRNPENNYPIRGTYKG